MFSNKQMRTWQRAFHLLAAVILGVYIYSPWGDLPAFTAFVRFGLFPALGLTGLILWQQPRIMKWLRAQGLGRRREMRRGENA